MIFRLWELNISVEFLHNIVAYISIFFPQNSKIKMEIFDFLNENYLSLPDFQILIQKSKYTNEQEKFLEFNGKILQIIILIFKEKQDEEILVKEEYFAQRIVIILIEFFKDIDNFSLIEVSH